jgi:pimeloyl-ACP methyl ester carboxylesterase
MARADDVLYPFLDVVEANLPQGSTVERLPADRNAWLRRLRELFASGSGTLREPASGTGERHAARGYVELGHGALHLYRYGEGPRAVLALHDPPGSGRDLEGLASALRGRAIVAPDLPGCGLSDPLDEEAGCEAYAAVLAGAMSSLGLPAFDVVATGLSVPVAVALAAACPDRVGRLLLDGMPALAPAEAASTALRYAPPILPSREGSHFVATWHRLRDEQLQWPWYDGTQAARRYVEPQIDAARLHHRLVAVLQQPDAYGRACRAALRYGLEEAMAQLTMPTAVMDASPDPRYAGAHRLAAAAPRGLLIRRPAEEAAVMQGVAEFLGR